jgi:hypothetical protein
MVEVIKNGKDPVTLRKEIHVGSFPTPAAGIAPVSPNPTTAPTLTVVSPSPTAIPQSPSPSPTPTPRQTPPVSPSPVPSASIVEVSPTPIAVPLPSEVALDVSIDVKKVNTIVEFKAESDRKGEMATGHLGLGVAHWT